MRSDPKQKNTDISKIKSFKFHTIGHFSYLCPQKKIKKRKHNVDKLPPRKKRRHIWWRLKRVLLSIPKDLIRTWRYRQGLYTCKEYKGIFFEQW